MPVMMIMMMDLVVVVVVVVAIFPMMIIFNILFVFLSVVCFCFLRGDGI